LANVTSELSAKIAATRFEDLPPAAVAAGRQLVADGLAIAMAGCDDAAIRILAAYYRAAEARADAPVFGHGFRTIPAMAAAVNGAAMHVLDFEPMWKPANHALSPTLPVILALASIRPVDGRMLVTALVKGLEIQGLIRDASGQYEHLDASFHPPGLVGPFGAAIAASHVLGFDAAQVANVLGIAGSRAGGLHANVGTMTKATHCGLAGAAGLDAALLTERGFSGNRETFDAPRGFSRTFFRDKFDHAKLLRFGPPFRVIDPGYALKMFPSHYGTHFAITAALELFPRIASAEAIRSILIVTPEFININRPRPESGLSGKFSFQYTVAVALLDGAVGVAAFSDERVNDPRIAALLDKTQLTMSPDIPARFDAMHVVVSVELADGRKLTARCDGPRGIWGGAPVDAQAHRKKVVNCLGTRLSPPRIERVVEIAGRIERSTAEEIREIVTIMGCFE
jgi:2-methylcitrate dehydratase PrpD